MKSVTIGSERRWAKGGWLLAAVDLLSLASCRAPAPEAGRYQMSVASTGGGEASVRTTVYIMDMYLPDKEELRRVISHQLAEKGAE